MIKLSPSAKNKINLEDYDYQQDIANRLLMSDFSVFDVEVLEAILYSSLKLTISDLATELNADPLRVMEVVDKLSQTDLCTRVGEQVTVDKEVRKYFEFQVEKFDDDFQANMDFLQRLLRKVPIHVLPQWYAIPRAAGNIFESLIDKYLKTPRIYRRYLLELGFENEVLIGIMNDVFDAPDYKVRGRDLRKKYNLSREEFEEHMLLLEFNFICCLSYNQIGGEWHEVVTPFSEWRRFLRFRRDTIPETIEEAGKIEETRSGDLVFANDLLRALKEKKLPADLPDDYKEWLSSKMTLLGIAQVDGNKVKVLADEWLDETAEDVAIAIYRHPANELTQVEVSSSLCTDKNYRQIEKHLARVSDCGWITLEGFKKGLIARINGQEPTLAKRARKWAYHLPTYSDEEKRFIRGAVLHSFFEAGYVATGTLDGKPVLRVTDFGRSMLT